MMKKVVLKLDLNDEKRKRKAMDAVSSILGVYEIALDMKEKKLTVTGKIDPVKVMSKVEKVCRARLVHVGPAKEEDKKGVARPSPEPEQVPVHMPSSSCSHPPYHTYIPTPSAPPAPYFATTPDQAYYPANYGYNNWFL